MKELQQKIVDLGSDPSDPKLDKDLLKEKDNGLQIMKKKLKIPDTQHI